MARRVRISSLNGRFIIASLVSVFVIDSSIPVWAGPGKGPHPTTSGLATGTTGAIGGAVGWGGNRSGQANGTVAAYHSSPWSQQAHAAAGSVAYGVHNGDGSLISAGAATGVVASASRHGATLTATASGTASAAAAAVTPAGTAISVTDVSAVATATSGPNPTASAEADSSTFAVAVGGRHPTTYAVTDDGQVVTEQLRGESVSVAYEVNGTYAIAVSTRKSAFAEAGALAAGIAVTASNVLSAAISAISVFAGATSNTAFAGAGAFAASGGSAFGAGAFANSSSTAYATISWSGPSTASVALHVGGRVEACKLSELKKKLYCLDHVQ